jgi:SAM-dependent methyltransferase
MASSVSDHYLTLLGPVYRWMLGDPDAARAAASAQLQDLGLRGPGIAVDLGAGPGYHAVALAALGYDVFAIDGFEPFLAGIPAPVQAIHADLLAFRAHVPACDLVVCLGDTLPHLADETAVAALFDEVAAALRPGGRFVVTLRDATRPLEGTARFIPVRSDADRILTCFLEYGPCHIEVHDILSERVGDGFTTKVSAYRKLRLFPDDLVAKLAARGLAIERRDAARGWVILSARRE